MRVVFLDRDGVINDNKDNGYITSVEEFSLLPGVVESIKMLNDCGFEVIIVSNQAGIAKGVVSWSALREIEQLLRRRLREVSGTILKVYYCPHLPESGCGCRKPEIGLLLRAAKDFALDLSTAFLVGDAITDIEAGKRVGCYSILVKSGRARAQFQEQRSWPVKPDNIVAHLPEAVQVILSNCARPVWMDVRSAYLR